MSKKLLDLEGLEKLVDNLKAYADNASGGGAVVDIGTFDSEAEMILYLIWNALPTGLYKTGFGSSGKGSFLVSLLDNGNTYIAAIIAPAGLTHVVVSKTGEIVTKVEYWYEELADKTYVDNAIQAAIQNTWNGEY